MCTEVESRCLLANLLARSKKKVDTYIINTYRDNVYKELRERCLYIDVTRDGVRYAVEHNPHMFVKKGKFIGKASHSKRFFSKKYLSDYINNDIPVEIVEAMQTVNIQHA